MTETEKQIVALNQRIDLLLFLRGTSISIQQKIIDLLKERDSLLALPRITKKQLRAIMGGIQDLASSIYEGTSPECKYPLSANTINITLDALVKKIEYIRPEVDKLYSISGGENNELILKGE